MSIIKVLKDPLTHFLVVGFAIYAALSFGEQYEDSDEIVITRDTLIEFVQARSKAFDEELANTQLEQMSDAELQSLILQFEREEALYREAKKLGLEQGDYVIRRRLVGKMEFLTDPQLPNFDPDDEEMERFFASNSEDYSIPAIVTFSHVFLSADDGPGTDLGKNAQVVLDKLLAEDIVPERAIDFGDRFLFHTHYVNRNYSFVAAELGQDSAKEIFADDAPTDRWFGPVYSNYGAHLIFLSSRAPARSPLLAEVRSRVAYDFRRWKRQELRASLEDAVISSYKSQIAPDLQQWLDDRASRSDDQLFSMSAGNAK